MEGWGEGMGATVLCAQNWGGGQAMNEIGSCSDRLQNKIEGDGEGGRGVFPF
jgi:hypothetical protein